MLFLVSYYPEREMSLSERLGKSPLGSYNSVRQMFG